MAAVTESIIFCIGTAACPYRTGAVQKYRENESIVVTNIFRACYIQELTQHKST
jgi:hypothetical protein